MVKVAVRKDEHRIGRMVDGCGGGGEAGGEEGRQEAARVSVSLGRHVS